MSSSKKEKEEEQPHSQYVCPVCQRVVPVCDLPNKSGVIQDNIYFVGGVKIVNSEVRIFCEFSHMHDEKENVIDDHGLIADISTHFDHTGKCTGFDIVNLLPEKGGD